MSGVYSQNNEDMYCFLCYIKARHFWYILYLVYYKSAGSITNIYLYKKNQLPIASHVKLLTY